ncbi:MAG: kinase/pyrophosphorylase, partial [Anaerolineae bacterium]
GWFVANVPIVLKTKPPVELFDLPPGRVCGLTIDPARLVEFRKVRYDHLGGAAGDYANSEHVRREIEYAMNIFRSQHGWPVVEVTDKPIEEISSEILALVGR